MDALTDSYNRYFLDKNLGLEFKKFVEQDIPFSMIMMDLDDFKAINDNFGHEAGDFVLKKTVYTVKKMLKNQDKIVRYGGEEFLILLPDTTLENAGKIAEKIRVTLTHTHFEEITKVTSSFGVVSLSEFENFDDLDETIKQFMKKADEYLYTGKKSGKNIVISSLSNNQN